mmetsp:Transcript_2612/g.7122  ORF Transcript_2612/g.7122 Transcript_2612/m.7122 type:complete len:270 (+) Transcript_2612:167-976(+)
MDVQPERVQALVADQIVREGGVILQIGGVLVAQVPQIPEELGPELHDGRVRGFRKEVLEGPLQEALKEPRVGGPEGPSVLLRQDEPRRPADGDVRVAAQEAAQGRSEGPIELRLEVVADLVPDRSQNREVGDDVPEHVDGLEELVDPIVQRLREELVDGLALQEGVDRLRVAVQIDVLNPPQQPLGRLLAQQFSQGVAAGVAARHLSNDPVPVGDDRGLQLVEEFAIGRQLAADRDGFLPGQERLQGLALDPVDDAPDTRCCGLGRRRG